MAAKKKTKKVTKKIEPPKLIPEDCYSLIMSREEILSAVQILSFAQATFEQMAIEAEKNGDENSLRVWAARAKLSLLLYGKLRDVANIGEPTSREVH